MEDGDACRCSKPQASWFSNISVALWQEVLPGGTSGVAVGGASIIDGGQADQGPFVASFLSRLPPCEVGRVYRGPAKGGGPKPFKSILKQGSARTRKIPLLQQDTISLQRFGHTSFPPGQADVSLCYSLETLALSSPGRKCEGEDGGEE